MIIVGYILLFAFLIAGYILTISRIRSYIAPSDVILVLGCAAPNGVVSGMLQERLDEALSLFLKGYAPYILVSGGVGVGQALSEATVMQHYLIAKGVPRNRILVENRSIRTWDNLAFSKQIIDRYQLKKVLIVTSSFHLARSIVTARSLGYQWIYFSGASSKAHDFQFFVQYVRELVGLIFYFLGGFYLNNNQAFQKRAKDVPFIPQYVSVKDYPLSTKKHGDSR
ncbi:YdcF family protein [Entomospira entomophila]|uniref:YdcF family protein n=1 Tax=Entomospira entomophila TaxID=2719988 RepID=A0A968G9I9_9SPIO|nr:YdcF family protein [Entomospira entomophilus]NIZ41075.1 YdcF family protein [Entomospira entomophilus]WDI35284.1 YdcF family protein [Entomospira entomophilus]